jgi:hypothetical protein
MREPAAVTALGEPARPHLSHRIAGSVQKADCNMVTDGIAAIYRDNVVTVRSEVNVVDRRSGMWVG